MRLILDSGTRVLIDLRAAGVLSAVGHDPMLSVRPGAWAADVGDLAAIDVPVDVRFDVASIEPPSDLPASDREKLRQNMCGPDVLDAARFPSIAFQGRYVGTLERGRLSGNIQLRGALRPLSMAIARHHPGEGAEAAEAGQRISLRGAWEGRLTELGVRPYRALLGAIKLSDWVRLRLELEGALSVR